MIHARLDYEAIQPWPQKRPHTELNIPEDEPVFLLRAKDVTAPTTVRCWAKFAEVEGADPELVGKVRAWADRMEDYAREHYNGGKRPDTPFGALR